MKKSAVAIAVFVIFVLALAVWWLKGNKPLELKRGGLQKVPADQNERAVELTGPGVILVFQSGKLRLVADFQKKGEGTLTLPFGALGSVAGPTTRALKAGFGDGDGDGDGSASQAFEVGVCPPTTDGCPPCWKEDPEGSGHYKEPSEWNCWEAPTPGGEAPCCPLAPPKNSQAK